MLHKVYGCIITVILLVALFVGYKAFQAHDAWKDFQAKLAVSEALEKQNKQVETKATTVIGTAQAANVNIDSNLNNKLKDMQSQVNSKPDTNQIKALIAASIPALPVKSEKAADGSDRLYIDDNQANRDLINKHDADFKTCKFELDACEQKQANSAIIIQQKDVIIAAMQNSLDLKTKDLKDATNFGKGGNIWARTGRVLLPIGCAGLGAWAASQAKASPKVIGVATVSSGVVCGFKFHF
jgi:hypothetical protein